MLKDNKKKDIKEVVKMLVQLDRNSLAIVKSSAEVLKARQELETNKTA